MYRICTMKFNIMLEHFLVCSDRSSLHFYTSGKFLRFSLWLCHLHLHRLVIKRYLVIKYWKEGTFIAPKIVKSVQNMYHEIQYNVGALSCLLRQELFTLLYIRQVFEIFTLTLPSSSSSSGDKTLSSDKILKRGYFLLPQK